MLGALHHQMDGDTDAGMDLADLLLVLGHLVGILDAVMREKLGQPCAQRSAQSIVHHAVVQKGRCLVMGQEGVIETADEHLGMVCHDLRQHRADARLVQRRRHRRGHDAVALNTRILFQRRQDYALLFFFYDVHRSRGRCCRMRIVRTEFAPVRPKFPMTA